MKKYIRYLLVLSSIIVFTVGKMRYCFNTELVGILLFGLANIVYSFEDIRNRVYFLFFNITFLGFLVARPTIDFFRGKEWWVFDFENIDFALNGIMLSLVFMLFGYFLCDGAINKKNKAKDKRYLGIINNKDYKLSYFDIANDSKLVYNLQIISAILLYISMFFYLSAEFEKLLFMKSRNYLEYYTSFKSGLPYVVTALGSMYKYFLCIFLATFPKKRQTFLPLCLYVISAVPSLLIGLRNPIVLNVIFVFLYYFTRDSINYFSNDDKNTSKRKDKWLGRIEWTLIVSLAPVCMFILGIYNYTREGSSAEITGIFNIIIDLFYKQGVSFDVLCIGFATIPKIQYTGFTNYTFGGIIDYFAHNKIAQILWGAKSLGNGNNIDMALYSNNFSHRMSYASRGQEYLDGHGWGSSYILETYADFGYIGIILFNIFLGALFAYMLRFMRKGSLQFSVILIILTGIYFCPRDAALGWLNFILYIQFIAPVIISYFIASLCVKEYSRRRHLLNMYIRD